jgi:hypothetical protein
MQHMLRLGEHRYMLLSLLPAVSGLDCLQPQTLHTSATAAVSSAQLQQQQLQQQFAEVWTKVLMRPVDEILQSSSKSSSGGSGSSASSGSTICGEEEFSLDVGMDSVGDSQSGASSAVGAEEIVPVKTTMQQQQLLAQVVRLLHQCPYINTSTDKQQQQQGRGASSTCVVDVGSIAMALYSLGTLTSSGDVTGDNTAATTATQKRAGSVSKESDEPCTSSISGPSLAVHAALAIHSPHVRATVISSIVAADAQVSGGAGGGAGGGADGAVAALDVLTAASDGGESGGGSGCDSDLVRLVFDTVDQHDGHAALMLACKSGGKGYFDGLVAHLMRAGRIERIIAASLCARPSRQHEALELVRLFHRAHPEHPSALALEGDEGATDKWEPLRSFVIAAGLQHRLLSLIPEEHA